MDGLLILTYLLAVSFVSAWRVSGIRCSHPNTSVATYGKQIKGPPAVDPVSVASWLTAMREFRTDCQNKIGFTGTAFRVPELKWAQTAYMGPQMHPYDRMFFDPALGNGTNGSVYTVDRWLADLNVRFGGIDKALLWPTYTNLGADDRNQLDLTRALPGGASSASHMLWINFTAAE